VQSHEPKKKKERAVLEPDAISHSVIVSVVEKGADWQMALALLAATSHVFMDPDIVRW